MVKRCISCILSLTFIFFCVVDSSAKGFSFHKNSNGFEAVQSQEYPDYDATLTLYRHKKTGAKVAHWKNHDVNKGFQISFKTPTLDDTGVNHVLEHCVCSGSKKYPDNNLLFKALSQTSNTFMNAMTYEDKTSYVASSLSEKQLLGFFDMFMDCAFNPLALEDEMIFERESHRFQEENADQDITETGTVYNEMGQATSNINYASMFNCFKSLYPDSSYSCLPGGVPESIRDLTYEHLIETWQNYYHPSNMFVALYGDLDIDEFLTFMDKNYLCNYNKKKIHADLKDTSLVSLPSKKEYDFAVDPSQDILNGSVETIAYSIDNMDGIEKNKLIALSQALNNTGSYFKKELSKELPSAISSAEFIEYGNKNIFCFCASGIKPEEAEKFERIVDDSIKDALENGFSDDIIATLDKNTISYLCQKQLEKRGMRVGFGIIINIGISDAWAKGKNIFDVFKGDEGESVNNCDLKNVISKAIVGNAHKVIAITSPRKDLFEQNKNKRQQELRNMKAKMSEKEQAELIEKTKKFENWVHEEPKEDVIKKLQLMKVDDLSIDIPENKAVREFIKGVNFISMPSDDEVLYSGNVIFDVSDMSGEEYSFARLLTNLIGVVNTKNHSKYDISNIFASQMFMPSLFPINFNKDGSVRVGILCSWMGKGDNYLNDLEFIRECILELDFNDYENIKTALAKVKTNLKNSITDTAYAEMIKRGKCFGKGSNKQVEKMFDIEFYKFLEKAEQEMDKNPKKFTSKLKQVSKLAFNKKGIIIGVEGRKEFIDNSKDNWLLFADKFYEPDVSEKSEEDKNNTTIDIKQREALNIGGNVQFNGIISYFGNMDLIKSGSLSVLSSLINDRYLVPNIRHKLGAYFCSFSFDSEYMTLLSGRDPGVSGTFDVFDKMPEFIRNMQISQEELNQYIINVYFNMIYANINYYPLNMMFDVLAGVTHDEKIELLSEVKNTKVSDLKIFADILEKLIKDGYRFTVGSGQIIDQNKEMFDVVLKMNS